MQETDNSSGVPTPFEAVQPGGLGSNWLGKLGYSVGAKLMASLFIAMAVIFLLFGYFSIRLHRKHLEAAALVSAEQQSEVLRRSASRYMLRNDRVGLYEMMLNMADQPGVVRVRIMNPEGVISYSTSAAEVGNSVDKGAEACYGCHAQSQPLTLLNRSDRFRVYQAATSRVLGVITPIENQPACSNAECHAHPATTQVLGVLDTDLSLAKVDESLAQDRRTMLAYTALAMIAVIALSGLFVWIVVHNPLQALKTGTEQVTSGSLGLQLPVNSNDEVGDLARSFNQMSARLQLAQAEITAWARTLEERVDEKTRELRQAHQRMLHVEKMATIGKMAAVVAHEINNPLSGILTYSKLVKRWIEKNTAETPRRDEMTGSLEMVASESKRCGELVKNLLSFSRVSPMNLAWCDLQQVLDRCLRLVQHKMDMAGIQLTLDLAPDLPVMHCDPAQIEQVALAAVINAIDAMPQGGNLWVSTALHVENAIELVIRDDGIGVPPEHLPHVFEPFYTTKEAGGSGLGLAISQNIVERHGGRIDLQSVVGQGTRITVVLPINSQEPLPAMEHQATGSELEVNR
jgi:two-component system NtrC family sensor kinase